MSNKYFPTNTMQMMWMTFFMLLIPSMYFLKFNNSILLEWTIIASMVTPVNMTIIMDNTSLLYSAVIILISANVLSFSTMYMMDDKFINRFTMLVIAFIISMNLLVYIPHLMVLLLGWDGLGITSFILVIYYQNPKSLSAGLVTAMTNRIGDVAILLSVAWTLSQGHWNILHMDMENTNSYKQMAMITIAAMTKSAQMPFSSWLPAAMAAPTPVSALVHSSTLVTAGVFLLIRFYPFLSSVPMFNKFILFIAVSTMIMAGISATTECDMKKIIALSTLSQLGMMMTSIGLGFPHMAFIHMVIHALFKALLFICAGNMINVHAHAQDLRWMGGTVYSMPITSTCMLIANTALCGFPFMSGFYSKDLIIETAMFTEQNSFMMSLILLSIGFTSFYSMRFSVVTTWGPRSHKPNASTIEDMKVVKPMITMTMLSIISGSAMMWTLPNPVFGSDLPLLMKMSTMLIMLSGVGLGWVTTITTTNHSKMISMHFSHYASCLMWFLVPLSTQFMMKMPFNYSHQLLKTVDQSWLENLGGQGTYNLIMKKSSNTIKNYPTMTNSYLMMSLFTSFSLVSMSMLFYCMWCKKHPSFSF